MKAVVMAGGVGSRLRPLTIERPKPMVPIVNKPVMGHILELLKYYNITEVIITVQYLANLIQDFFGDGSSLGMQIHYSVEETPLGTAGSVKSAQNLLDDTFLAQGTYDGLSNKFLLDMTDIRYANTFKVGGKPLICGLTVNNSPTIEDVWNSTPASSMASAMR